jgi:hypothetical protein
MNPSRRSICKTGRAIARVISLSEAGLNAVLRRRNLVADVLFSHIAWGWGVATWIGQNCQRDTLTSDNFGDDSTRAGNELAADDDCDIVCYIAN